MASGAHLSAAASTTHSPHLDADPGMDTSSPSKRRMGGDASPEAASPGPKRLAQHHSGPDPTRGTAASLDELTFQVLKLHEQRNIDANYFKQIYNVIEDHRARITIAHKFMKSETARLKSHITLNATLATDNDAKIKEGLALLEAQVISNGDATAELRKDVQGAVHGISQQVGATPTASSDPEIQSLRARASTLPKQLLTAATRFFNAPNHWLDSCELKKCIDI